MKIYCPYCNRPQELIMDADEEVYFLRCNKCGFRSPGADKQMMVEPLFNSMIDKILCYKAEHTEARWNLRACQDELEAIKLKAKPNKKDLTRALLLQQYTETCIREITEANDALTRMVHMRHLDVERRVLGDKLGLT